MGSPVLSKVSESDARLLQGSECMNTPTTPLARLWMNKTGLIKKSLTAVGEWRGREVIVLAGRQIMVIGQWVIKGINTQLQEQDVR